MNVSIFVTTFYDGDTTRGHLHSPLRGFRECPTALLEFPPRRSSGKSPFRQWHRYANTGDRGSGQNVVVKRPALRRLTFRQALRPE